MLMTQPGKTGRRASDGEHFETVSEAVADARNQVLFNHNIPAVNRNKEIIRILDAKGTFYIKNAVVLVAHALGISKNTVYLHLRDGQKEPDA